MRDPTRGGVSSALNVVCPASYDLGEAAKIVILSVTEGEDKPLKYPSIFFKSELLVVNKVDLLPYVPFDIAAAEENAAKYIREWRSCASPAGREMGWMSG